MKDQNKLQNKASEPSRKTKMVRIKFRPGRAIDGVGGPGDVVPVSESEADRIVAMGYADRLED